MATSNYKPLLEEPLLPEELAEEQNNNAAANNHDPPDLSSSLLQGEKEIEWQAIQNLDSFFSRIYNYFEEKGFWCILTSRLLNSVIILFIIGMSTYLCVFVDWRSVWYCDVADKQSCRFVFGPRKDPLHNLNMFHAVVLSFEGVFSLYWLFTFFKIFYDLKGSLEMKYFFNKDLGISEDDMATLQWSELVEKLVRLQDTRTLSIVKRLTAHDIVMRIMRKENYLIAFINKDILNLRLPFMRGQFLTKTLEWNLRYIVNYMFDDQFRIRKEMLANPSKLRNRFILLGFLNFIAAPFLFIFLIVYFFFRYTAEIRDSPASLGVRKWSPLSLWMFREFNELPHIFRKRMNESYTHANKYIMQFPMYMLSLFGSAVLFISGGFAAVIIVLNLVRSPLLLHTEIGGQNLIWWLTVFTIVAAAAKTCIIGEHDIFDPNVTMTKVAACTHYFPPSWRGRAHHISVLSEFKGLFQYHVVLFLQEIFSVLFTPLILWFSLPKCSEDIVEFLRETTVSVKGVGDVCGFATFDFKKHGSKGFAPSGSRLGARLRSEQGKMEKSFLNFMVHNPVWVPPAELGADKIMSKFNEFADEEQERSSMMMSLIADSTAPSGMRRAHFPSTGGGQSEIEMTVFKNKSPESSSVATTSSSMSTSALQHRQQASSGMMESSYEREIKLTNMLRKFYESRFSASEDVAQSNDDDDA